VGHGLRRLVCISEDGFTTLSALKWLAAVDASFVMLSRNGKVLFVTGPILNLSPSAAIDYDWPRAPFACKQEKNVLFMEVVSGVPSCTNRISTIGEPGCAAIGWRCIQKSPFFSLKSPQSPQ
jgi:hypothetical protein